MTYTNAQINSKPMAQAKYFIVFLDPNGGMEKQYFIIFFIFSKLMTTMLKFEKREKMKRMEL